MLDKLILISIWLVLVVIFGLVNVWVSLFVGWLANGPTRGHYWRRFMVDGSLTFFTISTVCTSLFGLYSAWSLYNKLAPNGGNPVRIGYLFLLTSMSLLYVVIANVTYMTLSLAGAPERRVAYRHYFTVFALVGVGITLSFLMMWCVVI